MIFTAADHCRASPDGFSRGYFSRPVRRGLFKAKTKILSCSSQFLPARFVAFLLLPWVTATLPTRIPPPDPGRSSRPHDDAFISGCGEKSSRPAHPSRSRAQWFGEFRPASVIARPPSFRQNRRHNDSVHDIYQQTGATIHFQKEMKALLDPVFQA